MVPAGCNYRAFGFDLTLGEVVPTVFALRECQRGGQEWRSLLRDRLRGKT